MKIPDETRAWLKTAEQPYIQYNMMKLLTPANADHKQLQNDPFIKENIMLIKDWDANILQRHNVPYQHIHRLAMLADLGVKADDPGMPPIIEAVLNSVNEQGIPEILIQIPPNFGGSGKPEHLWMICDFPTILYSLLKMGVHNDLTGKGIQTLTGLIDEDGMHCLGKDPKFKGPGPRKDICPYACLLTAKALSEEPKARQSKAAKTAISSLLGVWGERGKKKHFLFGIGTDFKKLKFPFVWYNLLHFLEVISRYPAFHQDASFQEMIEVLLSKTDETMRFKPESIYMAYKTNEFSNKKEPSKLITLLALRILNRIGRITL
jgi:hypothetical protein